ncbi:hypothetical protein OWV82_002545 [Melia azedarach]|uniref:Uncharacterized protein n=1 Tax=Melia azedarach TaxID=155640 RepID=A0ACC1Z293_MELAZ|nr:hypothetical protein OWV82_002545 [Melia azedarach]
MLVSISNLKNPKPRQQSVFPLTVWCGHSSPCKVFIFPSSRKQMAGFEKQVKERAKELKVFFPERSEDCGRFMQERLEQSEADEKIESDHPISLSV